MYMKRFSKKHEPEHDHQFNHSEKRGSRQDDLQMNWHFEFSLVIQDNTQTAGQLWVTTGKHCTSLGKESY